jgi:hypothetical protein
MCQRRPCWPTPADREQDKTVYILTPAIAGCESGEAPAHPSGPCTFLDENNLCCLHDLDLKPTEGQLALCHNRTPDGLHEQIGQTWNGDEGQALIDRWEANPPRGRRLTLIAQPAQWKHTRKRRKLNAA